MLFRSDDEVNWRNFYRVWMQFVNEYKNMGGRVTASSDAGFIYNTPGFSTIQELELLQEAGFYPGEAIRAGTYHAAQTLFKPTGKPIEFGVVEPGMLADLVIVDANPIQNLKQQCLGIPIFSVDSRVIDPETHAVLPPNEVGEIIMRGPQIFQGYWGDEAKTRVGKFLG